MKLVLWCCGGRGSCCFGGGGEEEKGRKGRRGGEGEGRGLVGGAECIKRPWSQVAGHLIFNSHQRHINSTLLPKAPVRDLLATISSSSIVPGVGQARVYAFGDCSSLAILLQHTTNHKAPAITAFLKGEFLRFFIHTSIHHFERALPCYLSFETTGIHLFNLFE